MQIKLNVLALGLVFSGLSSVVNAGASYYDPSNNASGNDAGKTVGYQLYSTIGCPGMELMDSGCPKETSNPASVAASQPEPAVTPVTASLPASTPAPAPVLAPAPIQIAKAETPSISGQTNQFCWFFSTPNNTNPYLSSR